MGHNIPSVHDRNFDQTIERAGVPVLVEFWKPGCGHCRALTAELERLQEAAGSTLLIVAMNTEDNHQIPAELEITTLPALALFRHGEFQRFIGGIGTKEEILKQLAGEEP